MNDMAEQIRLNLPRVLECRLCGKVQAECTCLFFMFPNDDETRVVDPETGGMKARKPEEYALIPVEALAEVARVYGYGAGKYEPHNWRRGYAWSLSYSALQRHLNAFWGGQQYDPESGLPHLAHAAFHIFTLLTYSSDENYKPKDDRAGER